MSIENAYVLIDSPHFSYLAMTRHKKRLAIYANAGQCSRKTQLTKNLSKSKKKNNSIKDSFMRSIKHETIGYIATVLRFKTHKFYCNCLVPHIVTTYKSKIISFVSSKQSQEENFAEKMETNHSDFLLSRGMSLREGGSLQMVND